MSEGASDAVTTVLARFVLTPIPQPPVAADAAITAIYAVMRAMARGAGSPLVTALGAVLGAAEPAVPALGSEARLGPAYRAMLNGAAAIEGGHASSAEASVVAAALAAAEQANASGRALVEAVLVGLEIAARLNGVFLPLAGPRGWHDGVLDAIGSAAGAARLLAASEQQTGFALSLAATQASGLQSEVGSAVRSVDAGKAALNGVEAALLAKQGLTAPLTGIEAERGLQLLVGDPPPFAAALAGLGESWLIAASPTPAAATVRGDPPLEEMAHVGALVDWLKEA
jgi:2-methylcitrate dehydratase PrpD